MTTPKDFNEVGCRKCGKGGDWKIFTDGQGNFKAIHKCGHVSYFEITNKRDGLAIDMRQII